MDDDQPHLSKPPGPPQYQIGNMVFVTLRTITHKFVGRENIQIEFSSIAMGVVQQIAQFQYATGEAIAYQIRIPDNGGTDHITFCLESDVHSTYAAAAAEMETS